MASLVLGAAGAFVGSAFGPFGTSLGWALGAMAGNWLDPQKTQGPRLTDLKLQTSQYGLKIPRVWGTDRIAGQVIWQTDLIEHSSESSGKGGGPTVTNFTYSASFAELLCQGPIAGVIKIWADGRLVYDGNNGSSFPFTLYLGDEAQLADPTMEAALGAGNVPAFRGRAYLVFADMDLTPFGNRIPSLSVLVTTELTSNFRRLNTWAPEPVAFDIDPYTNPAVGYDGTAVTIFIQRWGDPRTGSPYTGEDMKLYATFARYSEAGNLIESNTGANDGQYTVGGYLSYRCRNVPGWWFNTVNGPHRHEATAPGRYLWADLWYGAATVAIDQGWGACQTDWVASWDGTKGYMLCELGFGSQQEPSGGGAVLRCYPLSVAFNSALPLFDYTVDAVVQGDNFQVNIDTDGTIWVVGEAKLLHLREIETDYGTQFELIHAWDWPAIAIETGNIFSFFGRGGMFCGDKVAQKGNHTGDALGQYAVDVFRLTTSAPYVELLGSIPFAGNDPVPSTINVNGVYNLGGGLGWVQDGMLAICADDGGPVALSEIVGDLSASAGLDPAQFDVSELTDLVDGYVIAAQMTARAGIEPLMAAYYFDAVEQDARAVFPKRGRAAAATIAAADLGAYSYGSDPVSPLSRTRTQESDLPRQVDCVYTRAEFDYEESSPPPAQRMIGEASETRTLALPIVLSAIKAKQVVDVQLFNAWIERDRLTIALSRKHARIVPTDVLIVDGKLYRTIDATETPYGPLTLQLVRTSTQSWYAGPAGGSGSGSAAGVDLTLRQLTALEMLELPYMDDTTKQSVYWAAMSGIDRTDWPGAGLYKSIDGGITYSLQTTATLASVIGYATTALGTYLGGNTWDELHTVTIQIRAGSLEPSGTSCSNVLAGANECALGAEIVQFRDATLVATRTYTLRGLLRGRRGTEWAMAMHTIGERFALLPPATRIDALPAEYGVTTNWRGVTAGTTLESATDVAFRSKGLPLLPLSPVHCGTGIDGSGGFLLQWTRRTRIGGEWLGNVDVPLGEATEEYEVAYFADASCSLEIGRTRGIAEPSLTVTSAMQTAIFGSPQSELFWTVCQVGAIGPGFDSLGRAPILADTEAFVAPVIEENVPVRGTNWHEDYTFTGGSPTNAERNFNWLQANYGPTWAFAYLWATTTAARDRFLSELTTQAQAVLNTMGGAEYAAPAGYLVPFGIVLVGGTFTPFGQPAAALALQAYAGGLNPNRRVSIVLPYANNDLT